jgi:hypothetical protein
VKSGRFDDASEEYAALARELRGLRNVDDLETEARRLRDTREAKKDRKREVKLDKQDQKQTRRLFMLLRLLQQEETSTLAMNPALPRADSNSTYEDMHSLGSHGYFPAENAGVSARRELRDRIRRLKSNLASKKAERRLVARRVIDGFRISAFYDGMEQLVKGNTQAAKVAFEYCVEAAPENAYFRYELARSLAALRDKKNALKELRQAVEDGFGDGERLASEDEWKSVREESGYLEILNQLRRKP